MMEKNQIFENIMSRTSVRSYTDIPVEREKVEMMLRAGMAAPSACQHGEAGTARHRGLRMP